MSCAGMGGLDAGCASLGGGTGEGWVLLMVVTLGGDWMVVLEVLDGVLSSSSTVGGARLDDRECCAEVRFDEFNPVDSTTRP